MGDKKVANALGWLAGGGEMGKVIAEMDWTRTPLGPLQSWPQSLRTTVSLCLASNFPISIAWGPEHTQLYNDGYWPICGAKHPYSMGQPFKECWETPWPVIGDAFAQALTGRAAYLENRRMFLDRNGYLEETFFTFSFSPIRDDDGKVGGLFHPVTETTAKMVSERRVRLLRDLAARMQKAKTVDDACVLAVQAFCEDAFDLPFVAVYLNMWDSGQARLVAATGLNEGAQARPEYLPLFASSPAAGTWPLAELSGGDSLQVVDDLATRFGPLVCAPYPETVDQAIMLAIRVPGTDRAVGTVIAGVSPRRPLDEDYLGFYEMIGSALNSAVHSAHAYQEECLRAERLAELDRAKTTFFSNVSHELRTPLTLILGPLEEMLAHAGATLSAGDQQNLRLAHRSSLRLLKLVNTLLDFSRIEAGRLHATYAPTDLSILTTNFASVFRSAVEKAGLDFCIDVEANCEPVYVDQDMWEKIVLNLVANAFKFTLKGSITVTLRRDEDAVELQVKDTGCGIPKAELTNVFKRFHRIAASKGRSFEGTGIGLALVQELVQLHGGSVSVMSSEGSGTCFCVRIPLGKDHLPPDHLLLGPRANMNSTDNLAEAFCEEALMLLQPPEGSPSRSPVRSPTSASADSAASCDGDPLPTYAGGTVAANPEDRGPRAKILVVDDNADMRDYVTRLLAGRFTVQTAGDGYAALAALQGELPDLVLTDIMMPNLDGFGLLAQLRADPRTRALPVILLSARAGEESRIDGLEAGADDYLVKPFGARELVARVQANLSMAKMREETNRGEERLRAAEARSRLLREESRRKDEFLAMLAHELRNPLASIGNAAQLLRLTSENSETVGIIDRQVRHLSRLIGDLLDVSRITQGKIELRLELIQVTEVLRRAAQQVAPLAQARGHKLSVAYGTDSMEVLADPMRLEQVLINLLQNAVKYTDPGGRIRIEAELDGDEVLIAIADNGIGMDPDLLPRVFDLFTQGERALARSEGGLGIGLTLVKTLAEMHHGSISVESAGLGQGSVFSLRLPVARPDVAKTAVAATPVAKTAVVATPVAKTAVVATPVAKTAVAAKPVAKTAVAATPVAKTAVAATPVANTAVAAKPVAKTAVAAKPVATPVAAALEDTELAQPSADVLVTRSLVQSPQVTGRQRRVLVVDDNKDITSLMAQLLKIEGHSVQTAHDGSRGLAMAIAEHPDVVFLDIGMPGMDGYEVARRIRSDPTLTSTLLVAVTGYGGETDRQSALDAGFNQHLVKPVTVEALVSLMAGSEAVG